MSIDLRRVACILLVTCSMIFSCGNSNADEVVRYEDGNGGHMWYRLYLPNNYDPSRSYPLTTFLHGNDGTNIRPVVNPEEDVDRPPIGLVDALASNYDSILMAPQLERGDWRRFDNDRLIREAIEDVQQRYQTDPSRRYLTGLSFGGFGTFHFLQEYPDFFAAGAPIAGYYFPENPSEPDPLADYAERVRHIPTWVFHGTSDLVVPTDSSRIVVDALRAADANVRYSEISRGQHEVWNRVYDVDNFPGSAVFQLKVNTQEQTFQILADAATETNDGLYRFSVNLLGADSIFNVSPKSDFSPETGTPVGFSAIRSQDNASPIRGSQRLGIPEAELVRGFGQEAGSLPGAGNGTGEVQAEYGAPLLIAEGTFSDLAALGFSDQIDSRNLGPVYASFVNELGVERYGAAHTQIYHDGQLVYSNGDNQSFYPWLFDQRLVPEPSSLTLVWLAMGFVSLFRRNDA